MSDAPIDPRYLEIFPQWLRSLGEDAAGIAEAVAAGGDDDAARSLVSGLNYIFKSLDLIPDGIDDLHGNRERRERTIHVVQHRGASGGGRSAQDRAVLGLADYHPERPELDAAVGSG